MERPNLLQLPVPSPTDLAAFRSLDLANLPGPHEAWSSCDLAQLLANM